MATITSAGLGSGLDVNGIISKLMAVEAQPLTKLNTKESSYQSRISALGGLQGAVASLNTAVSNLTPATGQTASSKYISYRASLADSSIATASAVSTSTPGSYSLEVSQLATAHRISTVTQAQKLGSALLAEKGIASGDLNIHIQGSGYIQAMLPDTSMVYTTASNLKIDSAGKLVTPEGYVVQPGLTMPTGTESVTISSTGDIIAHGSSMAETAVGTLQLAQFTDASALDAYAGGGGYYTASSSSGSAVMSAPGSGGNGTLTTGYTSISDRVPRGTLSIQVGSTTAVNVVIDSTNDTLDGLKSAINAGNTGVTASIAGDSTAGYRLVLTSNTAGGSGKMTLSGLAGFDFSSTTLTGSLSQASAVGGQGALGGYTSADSTIATGTLTVTLGSGVTKDIVIDSTNNTLGGLRDALNSSGLGITAGLTSIGTNDVRLTLTSGTAGTAGQIKLSGLTGFDFDAAASSSSFSQATSDGGQIAQGSIIKLNGITLNRDSNTITDALQGVTLNLNQKTVTGTPTTLTIAHDKTSNLSANLGAMVKAYNDFNKTIRDLSSFDAETKKAGALLGDATLRSVSNSIRNALQGSYVATGDYKRLSDLGLAVQRDGSIIFDPTKLANATSKDFTAVANLTSAFATAAKTLTAGMLGTTGTITAATDGAKRSIKDVNDQRERLSLRLTQVEARYRKQFTSLDSLVASMNQTSSYLTRQLASLPGGSSSQ